MARIRRPLSALATNTAANTLTPLGVENTTTTTRKRRSLNSINEPSTGTSPRPAKKARGATAAPKSESDILDVSSITRTDLYPDHDSEPDSTDSDDFIDNPIPVFDTCDTVRRKIRALLQPHRDPNTKTTHIPITQAAFLRAVVAATYGPESTKTIQSVTLTSFMKKKGPLAGNTSTVYYAAYVFFEKLRIKQGKPKSNDREIMESIWARRGGIDTRTVAGSIRRLGGARTGGHRYDKYGLVFAA